MLNENSTLASIAYVLGKTLAEDYGIDPTPIFAPSGIECWASFQPGERVSDRAMDEVWARALHMSGDPMIGLKAGFNKRPGHYYAFGHSWLASESLLGAMRRLCRYHLVISTAADRLAARFTEADMESPFVTAIPEVAEATDRIADHYLDALDTSKVAARVRRLLIDYLPSGHTGQDRVARSLQRSASTLQKQLQSEGTSYREVLEDTRRNLATAYLRDGKYSHAQIAYLLRFSDQSNFSRAFKRWTGRGPRAFQEAQRQAWQTGGGRHRMLSGTTEKSTTLQASFWHTGTSPAMSGWRMKRKNGGRSCE